MKRKYSRIYLFGLILCLASCSTSSEITLEQARKIHSSNIYAVLHTPKKSYHLHDFKLTSDSLTGYVWPSRKRYGTFLYFYSHKQVEGIVNSRNNPYYSAHVDEIYKAESREDSENNDTTISIIVSIVLCTMWML